MVHAFICRALHPRPCNGLFPDNTDHVPDSDLVDSFRGSGPIIGIKDFYNWILTLLAVSGIFYTVPVFVVLLVQFKIFSAKVISVRQRFSYTSVSGCSSASFGADPTPVLSTIYGGSVCRSLRSGSVRRKKN